MGGRQHHGRAKQHESRRQFLKRSAAAGAVVSVGSLVGASRAPGQTAAGVSGFDHVAVPMQNTDGMIRFYRALGMVVNEGAQICSVHFGDNKINLHRPEMWRREEFTLRAPAARPPCGRFLFRVGKHRRVVASSAGPCRRRGHRGTRRATRRAGRRHGGWHESLHSGSRRQSAGVHHLFVSP